MSQAGFFLYTGDWLKDTRVLSVAARGCWADALCFLNEHAGTVTWPLQSFAKFWGMSNEESREILDELAITQVGNVEWQNDGKTLAKLSNRRMLREIQKRAETKEKRAEAGKKGAARRWQKCGSSESSPSPSLFKSQKEKIIHPISDDPQKWPNPILLIAKYNAETPDCLPAIEKATPARLRKARDYLKIFPDESFWTEAFQEIAKSDFLLGLRGNNGHESFKANFDWLLTKGKDGTENVVKVFEGRYRNGTNQGFKQYR